MTWYWSPQGVDWKCEEREREREREGATYRLPDTVACEKMILIDNENDTVVVML